MTVSLSVMPHWKEPLTGGLSPQAPAGRHDSGVSSLRTEFLLKSTSTLKSRIPPPHPHSAQLKHLSGKTENFLTKTPSKEIIVMILPHL